MQNYKTILGIETSCDETAAAVLQKTGDKIEILSNVISSSAQLQQKYGGIIPEQAAREQLKTIIPVITEALIQSNLYPPSSKPHLLTSTIHPPAIDAIAVTQGPGLIGSLLVGVETAKTLSLIWKKPLIPINHLLGHFYANWINLGNVSSIKNHGESSKTPNTKYVIQVPSFPCIGLLVSGGHTDLVLFKNHNDYIYLGGTRDDAAGECFDKCARLLGLPYPGGPEISKLAKSGNPKSFNLPSPMLSSNDFDFSYSGLKTAVANLVSRGDWKEGSWRAPAMKRSGMRRYDGKPTRQDPEKFTDLNNLCASIEQAIITPLVKKTIKAAKQYNVKTIILGGGVSANQKLCKSLILEIRNLKLEISVHIPPSRLCTDNAAMIASASFFSDPIPDTEKIQANPNLSLSY